MAGLQLGEQVESDLSRAELLALPILVLLSILIFGGRAALLPLIVGVTTVLGTFLVLTGLNQVYGLSVFALNLVIGLGLGLAIDYSLFLVSRYREELDGRARRRPPSHHHAHRGPHRRLLGGHRRRRPRHPRRLPDGLPAVDGHRRRRRRRRRRRGLAGDRAGRLRALGRQARPPQGARRAEGRWYRFSHAVMRRPGAIAVATAAVMVVLAAPALRAEWTPVDGTVIPEGLSSRTVDDTLARSTAATAARR